MLSLCFGRGMHCFFQREALKHEVPRPSFIYPGRHEACGKHKGVDDVVVMAAIAPRLNLCLDLWSMLLDKTIQSTGKY